MSGRDGYDKYDEYENLTPGTSWYEGGGDWRARERRQRGEMCEGAVFIVLTIMVILVGVVLL